MLFYKAQSKKSALRRRGPALISDIDETGATVKFQSQTFKVARFCARKRREEKDVEGDELDPVRARFHQGGYAFDVQLGKLYAGKDMEVDREDGNSTLSTGTPMSGSGRRPEMAPAPDPPNLSAQLLAPQNSTLRSQPFESAFGRTCAPFQALRADRAQYHRLTCGQLRDQCSQRGCKEKESKATLKTRLSTMDAAEANRTLAEKAQADGERGRAPVEGVKVSDDPAKPEN